VTTKIPTIIDRDKAAVAVAYWIGGVRALNTGAEAFRG
jgi:hypothetical protein